MKRKCQMCERWYDPDKTARGIPAGLCSRTCELDRKRIRANERASRRRVPPRPALRSMFAPSSRDWTEGRAKVEAEALCRLCKQPDNPARLGGKLEAAHIIARSQGGTDDPRGIVPLCAGDHYLYDSHDLDLGGVLTRDEEAYAVSLVGLEAAYRRINPVAYRAIRARAEAA